MNNEIQDLKSIIRHLNIMLDVLQNEVSNIKLELKCMKEELAIAQQTITEVHNVR